MRSTPLTDYLGHNFEPSPDARVLSLVPSLTELLYDLGLEDRLVGRTQYCIHPADRIDAIPSVGGTKKIKMSRVRDLAPTHALLNVDENPREMAEMLDGMGIRTVVTHPMHPDDNIGLYRLVGGLFGAGVRSERLVADYQTARTALLENKTFAPRRVLYLIWQSPWMAISADTYIANMLSLVNWHVATPGADPELAGDAARYPEIHIDEGALADIDLVLFSTEPFAFTQANIEAFRADFPAHAHKAQLIDGEMTSWYGSRAIQGLGYLRKFAEARIS